MKRAQQPLDHYHSEDGDKDRTSGMTKMTSASLCPNSAAGLAGSVWRFPVR
ncbi:hypothetical protein BDZ89DRAFT_1075137 [Hymenopellis radicata]|nr:hypothetical protein BDZ89DRAFT_1075137 [Hymenopellis radicata]